MTHPFYYFGAGPALLPTCVKEQAQSSLLNFQGSGVSILELSHRSQAFDAILDQAKANLRKLLAIPRDYAILFMHGGASAQFDAIALNLSLGASDARQNPLYLISGHWSRRAAQIAQHIRPVDTLNVFEQANIDSVLSEYLSTHRGRVPYVYATPNETIDGVEYYLDENFDAPLVADMTSCLLTRAVDISRYGLIFAGTQKMLGIAGLCLVIIRKDLLPKPSRIRPLLYDYRECYEQDSRINTPPVFAIYMCALMLEWYRSNAGVAHYEAQALQRSRMIYEVIDTSECYVNSIPADMRSRLNIVFQIHPENRMREFLQLAEQHGLGGLQGHRNVGGLRASMYNAMPMEGAVQLRETMLEFAAKY